MLAGWLTLNVYWPIDWGMDPRWVSLLMLIPQAVMLLLAALALADGTWGRRAPKTEAGR